MLFAERLLESLTVKIHQLMQVCRGAAIRVSGIEGCRRTVVALARSSKVRCRLTGRLQRHHGQSPRAERRARVGPIDNHVEALRLRAWRP
jgi:hypothetical protein